MIQLVAVVHQQGYAKAMDRSQGHAEIVRYRVGERLKLLYDAGKVARPVGDKRLRHDRLRLPLDKVTLSSRSCINTPSRIPSASIMC